MRISVINIKPKISCSYSKMPNGELFLMMVLPDGYWLEVVPEKR